MKIGPNGWRPDTTSTDTDKKSDVLRAPPLYAVDPTLALTFSVAAQEGSFSRAAAVLGVNPSTVSRRLEGLEASLGVRLFERDTRHLSLSDAGQAYEVYVQQALAALEAGRHAMESHTLEVTGRLRVSFAPAVGRRYMGDIALGFMALYPKVSMTLALDDRAGAGSKPTDDFDVAVSLGMPTESRAVVSKLGDISFGYVASPAFLSEYGVPSSAEQLAGLPLAGFAQGNALQDYGVVGQSPFELAGSPFKFAATNNEVLLQALLSGRFVGRVMLWPCLDHLANGRLVKVLPMLDDSVALYTVTPPRREKSLKAQLFIDYLKIHLSELIHSLESQLALLTVLEPSSSPKAAST